MNGPRALPRSLVATVILVVTPMLVRPAPARAQEDDDRVAAGVVYGSIGGILASGLIDIVTAPASARRYNRQLAVAPLIQPRTGRYGLGVSIPFGGGTPARPARVRRRSRPYAVQDAAPRSPGRAALASVGATLLPTVFGGIVGLTIDTGVGIGLLSLGWILGPSAGHWYAEQAGRGWLTVGIRTGLYVLGFVALTQVEFD